MLNERGRVDLEHIAELQMAGQMPMNYIADPDDMARSALFLLSDEARWTTGIVLPCDGGRSAA
ncbi:SDR family oxidoreductase [Mesorhizobium sp. A556]